MVHLMIWWEFSKEMVAGFISLPGGSEDKAKIVAELASRYSGWRGDVKC